MVFVDQTGWGVTVLVFRTVVLGTVVVEGGRVLIEVVVVVVVVLIVGTTTVLAVTVGVIEMVVWEPTSRRKSLSKAMGAPSAPLLLRIRRDQAPLQSWFFSKGLEGISAGLMCSRHAEIPC